MTLSFADIDSQHAELLPTRTVMSAFNMGGPHGGGDVITVADNHSCGVAIGNLQIPISLLLAASTTYGFGKAC